MDATRQTWNEAMTDIVVDFMEAAAHTLLHARKVYPQGIISFLNTSTVLLIRTGIDNS